MSSVEKHPPKTMLLAKAVRSFVGRGDHLHFASTPSRSNAAVREVARQFKDAAPAFTLSTSGFHSTAHLLALLRLGRRYLACFFGDNYPTPRPNRLYSRLIEEGAEIECWSLLSYVAALRAGALGHAWAMVPSLVGSSLASDLANKGHFRESSAELGNVGLVRAIRPDVTFVHAPMADTEGRVAFSAPYGESFWAAVGARRGVIATVDRLVSPDVLSRMPEAVRVPRSRLLAICHEPFGAHPQPLYTTPSFEYAGYVDDFEHYEAWRKMTEEPDLFARFVRDVLDDEGGSASYAAFAGERRLRALEEAARARTGCGDRPRVRPARPRSPIVELAARVIAERVRARGHSSILAGIGASFFAAHAAKRHLAEQGLPVSVMVETGLEDIACGEDCHGFLLSHDHISAARALSSVDDVLGGLTTGADNRCLGVLGAAEVDALGNVNSTRTREGSFLVGSGGANDIASAAAEVVVLATCERRRLVDAVAHVTSPGHRVSCIVTDRCAFERTSGAGARSAWRLTDIVIVDGESVTAALERVRSACTWDFTVSSEPRILESEGRKKAG